MQDSLPEQTAYPHRVALTAQSMLRRVDARLLVALISGLGLAAWLCPWPVTALLAVLAALSAAICAMLLPYGRRVVAALCTFIMFWGASYCLLQWWQYPDFLHEALTGGIVFAVRLLALLGLALVIPATLTPLTMGRVLSWYVELLTFSQLVARAPVIGPRVKQVHTLAWQSGLALAIMVAFLPKAFATLVSLKHTLALRARHLPLHRRITFMALATLRILSTQAWDMAVSISARNLYRPEPWRWQKPEP